jgi:hypothetical protein
LRKIKRKRKVKNRRARVLAGFQVKQNCPVLPGQPMAGTGNGV